MFKPMAEIREGLKALAHDRRGATVIEYGLAACLVALALVQSMGLATR